MATDDDPSTWFPMGGGDTSKKPPATKPTSDDPASWFPMGTDADTSKTTIGAPSFWSRVGSAVSDAAGYGAGVVGAATKGLSFGLSNPLDAAVAALLPKEGFGSGFGQMQQKFGQSQAQFEQQHPLVTAGAEIAGSLPTYAMGEGALRAAVPVVERTGIVPMAANLLGAAARNAAVSGAQSAGMAEGGIADRAKAGLQGAEFGAVAGPAAEAVGGAVSPIIRGLGGTSGSVSAGDAALGNLARTKYGIPIDATDLSSNQLLRTAADQSGKLPLSGARASIEAKQAAWQKAIVTQMGESGEGFTPKVMSDARTRTGQMFDNAAQNTTITQAETDTLINTKLAKIEADLDLTPMGEGERKALKANMDNIVKTAANGNGTISGSDYQALTRRGTPLDRAEGSGDPNVASIASDIRDALDDAFANSAAPQYQDMLRTARYQYRIMRTVEPLAAASRDGNITPDAFMQKVLQASRRFDPTGGGIAYTGGGDIGELARIGKLMRAAPQTGTADRALVSALALAPSGGAAYLADPTFLAGMPATIALNRAANMWLRSNALANNLITTGARPAAYAPSVIPGAASAYNALNRRE